MATGKGTGRVGDDGSVWSKMAHKGNGTGFGSSSCFRKTWRKLRLTKRSGSFSITFHNKGYVATYLVHRLVLMAFTGPCPKGMECCHNNGDYSDNRLGNLRWDTHINNEKDKRRHGTNVGNRGNVRGESNAGAKLSDDKVIKIRSLFALGETQVNLSKMFGVWQGVISLIVRGRSWKHVGGPIINLGRGGSRSSRKTRKKDLYESMRDKHSSL